MQSDPFAPPSKMRVRVAGREAAYPAAWLESADRVRGLADYLARRTAALLSGAGLDRAAGGGGWGGSKGGDIKIDAPTQHVLSRSSLVVTRDWVELRLGVNLPAHGRTIEGMKAARLVCDELVRTVGKVGNTLFHILISIQLYCVGGVEGQPGQRRGVAAPPVCRGPDRRPCLVSQARPGRLRHQRGAAGAGQRGGRHRHP